MNQSFKGTGVAIVTPFTSSLAVDFTALTNIIEQLIDGGINYIVSLGTTGETATLSFSEQKQIVQHTLQVVNNRVPIMVGAGGNNTKQLIAQMKEMENWGEFSTFLSVSPYYSKPSQEGIFQHYQALARETSKQILLYNVPGRTSKNIEPNTVLRLANIESIIGIKDAGNSVSQSKQLRELLPNDFLLISGDDDLYSEQLSLAYDGIISVVANAYPREWRQLTELGINQNFDGVHQLYEQFKEFVSLIFAENNPAGIKCAMNEMGLCNNLFRLPIVPVDSALDKKIRQFVKTFNSTQL